MDNTIEDAFVCDAVSRVSAAMISDLRVNTAAKGVKLFVQTLVVLQTTPVLDSGLVKWLHDPLRPSGICRHGQGSGLSGPRATPDFRHGQCTMNMNRYMNAECADIHFIYGLANRNERGWGKISNEVATETSNVRSGASEPGNFQSHD
ncbi:hypothetical protein TNCV_141831 [Trichonephila clavipes]|nr:hypothetical protein TNCV_141831 [Trichonephila clavipes]